MEKLAVTPTLYANVTFGMVRGGDVLTARTDDEREHDG
jgi:hypothetical protein